MGRAVRESRLESREARLRLTARAEPYWRAIEGGRHLGYWQGRKRSSWVARYRLKGGGYSKKIIGRADDHIDADGLTVLTFKQAQERARAWFQELALGGAKAGPYTVAMAIADYLDWFRDHRKSFRDAELRAKAHILPTLGATEIADLNTATIQRWLTNLSKQPPRQRTALGKTQQYREVAPGPDTTRKRRASANRTLTILKAALNQAWTHGKVASDLQWRRIKPFPQVNAPRIRYLSVAESQRLINACDADLRPLVQAALLTGARYGELVALRVRDYQADSGLIYVRESKSGKPRHIPLNDEGVALFEALTAGRPPNTVLLLRNDGNPWGPSHQRRPLIAAAERAGIEDVSFHILRHTYGSALAMSGVPQSVIAQALGQADTRITELHYGHLSPSYVYETVRAKLPKIAVAVEHPVSRLR